MTMTLRQLADAIKALPMDQQDAPAQIRMPGMRIDFYRNVTGLGRLRSLAALRYVIELEKSADAA
jgi:hypothetical protein